MKINKEYRLEDALVAYVFASQDVTHPEIRLGRTATQKICYFSQFLGVPLNLGFQIHHYGPFSEQLWGLLDNFVIDDVLIDESNDPEKYSNYKPGPEIKNLLDKYQPIIDEHKPTIDEVIRAFGKLKPNRLELVSTVHYISMAMKTSTGSVPNKKDVVDKFKKIKGNKFDTTDVEYVFDILKETNLLDIP